MNKISLPIFFSTIKSACAAAFSLLFLFVFCIPPAAAQANRKFNYEAQKKIIPVELGRAYIGMPFAEFAKKIDFARSEADDRYGWLEVKAPFNKGRMTEIYFKVYGLSAENAGNLFRTEKVTEKGEFGDYEREVRRLNPATVPPKAFVYEINLTFKPDFDIKNYLLKTYGKPSDVHKKGEPGYFYDWQWTKKTADGLTWLIRAFHEERKTLQLIGIIDGTQWDPNA